jgi:hypothetical protein
VKQVNRKYYKQGKSSVEKLIAKIIIKFKENLIILKITIK